jgi:hypothetical protein
MKTFATVIVVIVALLVTIVPTKGDCLYGKVETTDLSGSAETTLCEPCGLRCQCGTCAPGTRELPNAAIGAIWDVAHYDVVTYVDPASDLYGRVHIGDRMISIANLPPSTAISCGANLGYPGSIVAVEWAHNGRLYHQWVHRKRVSEFSPLMQAILHR